LIVRKLIVCNIVSLDGFYTGPDDNVMQLPMDAAFDAYNAERLRAADTLLLGRVSYELLRGYWPPVADDPHATDTQREISRLNGAIDKVVVSDTLPVERPEPWANTRVLRIAEAHDRVAELKHRSGKDIVVLGSHVLWNDLLAGGLVDELHLVIGPVILSSGTPLFTGDPGVRLRPLGMRTWDDSDNTVVRYAVGERDSPPTSGADHAIVTKERS
jgi:dihydrofolate reductase